MPQLLILSMFSCFGLIVESIKDFGGVSIVLFSPFVVDTTFIHGIVLKVGISLKWKLLNDCKCHNPNFGLATKARVCKSAGQERNPKVWESVRMNTHTPKWAPMLGVGVLADFQIFREWLQGSNPSPWEVLYIIGKLLKLRCLKWAHMTHLDIWNTSYGQKKGLESNWQFDSRQ
jgi:hypothetical protein